MSSCCSTHIDARPCPKCRRVGPIVGSAPVRPHLGDAVAGDWQHCTNGQCEIVFHLGVDMAVAESVSTQVGLKATDKATPVCFWFAHTADALGDDLAANDGVSGIKASIKAAVAASRCACEHPNPSGQCCLADVDRTLKRASPNRHRSPEHPQRIERTAEQKATRSTPR